jgi:hypothetical protein
VGSLRLKIIVSKINGEPKGLNPIGTHVDCRYLDISSLAIRHPTVVFLQQYPFYATNRVALKVVGRLST